jgi:hypothetical protein
MTRADVVASVPLLEPPGWALAERELLDLLDHAWRRFARDFTGPEGRLNYRHALTSRDGVDDFYEVFFNWPQLYLLGGADDLLAEAGRHWEGVTAQLTELGMLKDEYERGYDWFHQGESLLLLYFLTMADPVRWAERAVRFAELYVDPAHGNYDPHHPPPPQRLGPGAHRPVRRDALPLAGQGGASLRLPARLAGARWRARARARAGPAADRRDDRPHGHGGHSGEPRGRRARPERLDPDRRPTLPGLD